MSVDAAVLYSTTGLSLSTVLAIHTAYRLRQANSQLTVHNSQLTPCLKAIALYKKDIFSGSMDESSSSETTIANCGLRIDNCFGRALRNRY